MQLSAVLAIGVALLPSLAVAVNPWGFTSTCQGVSFPFYQLCVPRNLTHCAYLSTA